MPGILTLISTSVNDKIPFTMFLDNEVFNMYIRYLGKETVKTQVREIQSD